MHSQIHDLNYDTVNLVLSFDLLEKADIRRAACVCKSFSEPALDILWREMTTIVPLLRLIPGFRCRSKRDSCRDSTFDPTALSSEELLSRYDKYRMKIRVFRPKHSMNEPAIVSCIRLSAKFPVLPGLLVLGFADRDTDYDILRSFYSDTIFSVGLKLPYISNYYNRERLNLVRDSIRNLTSLTVKNNAHPIGDIPVFENLKSFAVEGIITKTNEELRYVCALKGLTHLGISLSDSSLDETLRFPALKSLKLQGSRSIIKKFMSLLDLNTVEELTLSIRSVRYESELWSQYNESEDDTKTMDLLTTTIPGNDGLVTLLPNLQVLRLLPYNEERTMVAMHELHSLFASLPKIRVLEIPDGARKDIISADGLKCLALHCPELTKLVLPISVSNVSLDPAFELCSKDNHPHRQLRHWHIPMLLIPRRDEIYQSALKNTCENVWKLFPNLQYPHDHHFRPGKPL